jgi:hypothetical protein
MAEAINIAKPQETARTNMLLASLLSLMVVLAMNLIGLLHQHQQLVQDRAELRHVRYGMLNADKWVQQASEIVEQRVRELQLRGEQREAMKRALERILDTLITEADRQLRLQHTSGDWWDRTTGKIKESLRGTLMDVDTIKAGIPEYAEQILTELEDPETRHDINVFLTGLISDITSTTFGQVDETLREEILQRNDCGDSITDCKLQINDQLVSTDRRALFLAKLALLCAALMLLLVHHRSNPDNRLQWMMLSGGALPLLLCGILTPMIEVEAQISELRFVLMGKPLEFFNEVLYFQSKSILDVVSILMATEAAKTMLVGVLLVTFSIIFPGLKLLASVLYVHRPEFSRKSVVVEFFALKSGKWSMADVMVIAILMSYVGFDGMITSQLKLIASGATTAGIEVLTTNGTALQPGFYMFLAFCIYSLLVSTLMDSAFNRTTPNT